MGGSLCSFLSIRMGIGETRLKADGERELVRLNAMGDSDRPGGPHHIITYAYLKCMKQDCITSMHEMGDDR